MINLTLYGRTLRVDILYQDNRIFVCIKPSGVLSTDEEDGLPGMIRNYLGDAKACVRTVHRLDRVVSGVMVLARSREATRILSEQVRGRAFEKEYLAVVHAVALPPKGELRDLLLRRKEEKKTYVVRETGKDVQEAVLEYEVLEEAGELSLVRIHLKTGRTHQIRAQFSSRGWPLVGDKKYGAEDTETGAIALWSYRLSFDHPQTGKKVKFSALPAAVEPWSRFSSLKTIHHGIEV